MSSRNVQLFCYNFEGFFVCRRVQPGEGKKVTNLRLFIRLHSGQKFGFLLQSRFPRLSAIDRYTIQKQSTNFTYKVEDTFQHGVNEKKQIKKGADLTFSFTVKPVNNDHPWGPKIMTLLTCGRCSEIICEVTFQNGTSK